MLNCRRTITFSVNGDDGLAFLEAATHTIRFLLLVRRFVNWITSLGYGALYRPTYRPVDKNYIPVFQMVGI